MTSMRNSALLGSCSGSASEHPASSLDDRTPAEPETYTYTLFGSFGSVTTVCVCEPRQVWTVARYFGCCGSVISRTRMPRARSLLTVSVTPCMPQSLRPFVASAETKSRLRYDGTSLCVPGQMYVVMSVGLEGLAMSHICQPL